MMNFSRTNSGLIMPSYVIRKQKKPTAFDFFAGCGGISLGFIQSGFEVVGAMEWDAPASLTYMVNLGSYPINIHYTDPDGKKKLNNACEKHIFKKRRKDEDLYKEYTSENGLYNDALGSRLSGSGWIKGYPEHEPVRHFWFGDVRKVSGKDILDALGMKQGELDCVCGGPPCQGFSRAGQQKIADPRNNLVYEYARLITELQPKAFMMEEVPDIVNFFDPDGVPVLDKFCFLLQEGGFGKLENLKKSMLMQTGCAVGLKGLRGSEKVGRSARHKPQPEKQEQVKQESLF